MKRSIPGMIHQRTFRGVFVNANHGAGVGEMAHADKTVQYSGNVVEVTD